MGGVHAFRGEVGVEDGEKVCKAASAVWSLISAPLIVWTIFGIGAETVGLFPWKANIESAKSRLAGTFQASTEGIVIGQLLVSVVAFGRLFPPFRQFPVRGVLGDDPDPCPSSCPAFPRRRLARTQDRVLRRVADLTSSKDVG